MNNTFILEETRKKDLFYINIVLNTNLTPILLLKGNEEGFKPLLVLNCVRISEITLEKLIELFAINPFELSYKEFDNKIREIKIGDLDYYFDNNIFSRNNNISIGEKRLELAKEFLEEKGFVIIEKDSPKLSDYNCCDFG